MEILLLYIIFIMFIYIYFFFLTIKQIFYLIVISALSLCWFVKLHLKIHFTTVFVIVI